MTCLWGRCRRRGTRRRGACGRARRRRRPRLGGSCRGGFDGVGPVEHATTSRVAAVATAIMAPDRRPGSRVVGVSGTRRRYLLDLGGSRRPRRRPRDPSSSTSTPVWTTPAPCSSRRHTPALDLRAVTCVGGNAPVDAVVRNTLTVLEAAARSDVPVARGADRSSARAPDGRPARPWRGRHGRPRLACPDPAARPPARGGACCATRASPPPTRARRSRSCRRRR